jgi:hypothetical protein
VLALLMSAALVQETRISVVDAGTGRPVACRVHLKDAAGKPVAAPGLPNWDDHFVCAGTTALKLPAGSYSAVVERGPEYESATGRFEFTEGGHGTFDASLKRIVDLAAQGWWSGEMHVHRPVDQVRLLMDAEDLHVAPVITWWNNRNAWLDRPAPAELLTRFEGDRWVHWMGGEDEREGGALLYFNLPRPLEIRGSGREFPSPMKFLAEARRQAGVWIDIEKPFWWDVPVWLASGQVDSIGLANNHMCRSRMYEDEAWGRPRDAARLPPPTGNGFWTQEIYAHVLNAGLRIPPSAGSASGVLPNPVGYNRIYAHLEGPLTYEKWWEAVRAGRTFVTNGPLLLARADGKLPGHVFASPGPLKLRLEIRTWGRDRIRALEVVRDGRIEPAQDGATVEFTRSGWFLVRALADNEATFRFASTAPFYVEIGEPKRPIHRASAQFFLDWVRQRIARVKLEDAAQREEVLSHHRAAEKFWQERVERADVE